jgi:hypothetical protein
MPRIILGLLCLASFVVAITAANAASVVGKWTTPKGAVLECTSAQCTVVKGKGEEGQGVGTVVLKDISSKDGKVTAKLNARRDRWVPVTLEVGDREMTLKAGKDERARSTVWTRTN